VVLPSAGSTNDEARALAAAGAPDGTVVLATQQLAGRGRLGRVWHSPAGLGLYVSVLLRPEEPPDRIGRYALASAVATCRACREQVGEQVRLKWPNDVTVGGRKLAGILAEVRGGAAGIELVVGIGVNVAHAADDFPGELRDRATSLRLAGAGSPIDGAAFAAALLRSFGDEVAALRRGAWGDVASRFVAYAPGADGTEVRLAGGPIGTTRGLDATGALRVETPRGIVLVHAGESVTPTGD